MAGHVRGAARPVMSVTAPTLPPHYYRDNFLTLCRTVEAQYADLLSESECGWLRAFRALPFEAQCLYVRLVSRVGPWFRESKLAYPEIGPLAALIDTLLEAGMLQLASQLSVGELGALCTREELRQACAPRLPQAAIGGTKAALLEALDELCLGGEDHVQLAAAVEGLRIVAPAHVAQVQLFQLLFFGNRRQSLTDFVLSDLGVARYYPYRLDRRLRLFEHRPALDEYLACAALEDGWRSCRDTGDGAALLELAGQLLSRGIAYPSSEGRWHRLCNALARELERRDEAEVAARLYARSQRHPARERRARIHERSKDWSAAATLCREILSEPWCEAESEAAARILVRVRRRLGQGAAPRRPEAFRQLSLALPRAQLPVELQVAAHLEADWRAVHYVENTLMNALFGLAFWEQIFAPVPGAFHNPYQSVPADMYAPEFRARRWQELALRLQQLRTGNIPGMLDRAWREYAGLQCRWVDWRRIDRELLAAAARTLPAGHLLAIWERMLFDPRDNRRGFPDLLALGERSGDYCLIEVKGPGDALQDSQKRWLRYFSAQGIPAAVARVEWTHD
ncbi:MAG: VRR-NUC domain-containing protein [Halioglobus sp.]|nr:VRR-NUC domain-containing protein [Halioglobus sp.]